MDKTVLNQYNHIQLFNVVKKQILYEKVCEIVFFILFNYEVFLLFLSL